jgi:hypothetical protein|tara:strand:- start:1257 stop:2060 length:804 start_codon:yes stop_codon:yes gene_type:complete
MIMISSKIIISWTLILLNAFQVDPDYTTEYIGVYRGNSLFIQNPYQNESSDYCITKIDLNGRSLKLNYQLSALIIDFKQIDLFSPVAIKIFRKDSLCKPIVINPDAIFYHSNFRFKKLVISDTLLEWETQGEHGRGDYLIERLYDGLWEPIAEVKSTSKFEKSTYGITPVLVPGANKFRIRYDFDNDKYLYSQELDYEYYPSPVIFNINDSFELLKLSRKAHYEVFDAGSAKVMEGDGIVINISKLKEGDYVIYFDGSAPAGFSKKN